MGENCVSYLFTKNSVADPGCFISDPDAKIPGPVYGVMDTTVHKKRNAKLQYFLQLLFLERGHHEPSTFSHTITEPLKKKNYVQ
jgi:hypothetical protein